MTTPTLQQLLDQHNKTMRAKADLDDINFLYPEDGQAGSQGLRETFYEGALRRYLDAAKVMKDLMAKASPDVLAEAKRIAKEQAPKNVL